MKRIIKKILLIVFVTATLLQSIQEVEAANRKVIHLQENVYGDYYNQDINIDQHKNTGMDVVEQSVTKLRYLNYFEQEEVEIVEEEFEYLEAIDETTTLYVSKEDSNLKKLVIGTGVVNYQDGESYQPINTEIIAEEPAGISTLAVSNTFYKNKTNTLTSVFGAQIHTDGLEYHKKDTVVEFVSSLIQEGDPVVKGSEIIYPLEQDMVLKYQINRGSVKEELILIAPTSITEYSSTIQVTNGIVKETATGLMIEEHTTPRLYYYYPVMKDANGATGPVTVSYQYDRIVYQLDQTFLANATYPVRITSEIVSNDDLHNVMAHEGLDVSVASNFAGSTIGYLTEEYYNFTGWNLLPEHNYHAFMYLGKQSKQVSGTPLGLTYSLYKIHDEVLDYYDLEAKYIKSAYFVTPINEMSAEDSMVYSCTIQSNLDISAVTFNDMNSLIGNSNVSCNNGTLVKENAEFAKLNITDYVRSLREASATNSGVLFLLAEEDNYLTLHAHDYYYTDAEDRTRSVPGVEI